MTNVTDNLTTAVNLRPIAQEEYDQLMDLFFWVQGVFYCVVGFTGVIANILNIIALSKSLKSATYKIFIAMACADVMVMLVVLGYSLTFYVYRPPTVSLGAPPNLKVVYTKYLWNHLWFHIYNIFTCASNWCSVLVAIFRLLVITFPLKATQYASSGRVTSSIVVVYLLSFIAQIPGWIAYRFNQHGALVVKERFYQYVTISVVINGPMPILICIITTLALVVQLFRSHDKMVGSIKKEQMTKRWKLQKNLTVTLLLVLSFFIATNLPSVAYWIMDEQGYFESMQVSIFKKNLFYAVSSACSILNYAGNFFIYILANSSFRKNLVTVLCQPCSVTKSTANTQISSLTYRHRYNESNNRRASLSSNDQFIVKETEALSQPLESQTN